MGTLGNRRCDRADCDHGPGGTAASLGDEHWRKLSHEGQRYCCGKCYRIVDTRRSHARRLQRSPDHILNPAAA